jgi:hexosaminidase
LSKILNLLPHPRSLKIQPGKFILPKRAALCLDASLSPEVVSSIAKRLQSGAKEIGVELILGSARSSRAVLGALAEHPDIITLRAANRAPDEAPAATRRGACSPGSERYSLTISKNGIEIYFRETPGLRAAAATLRQLFREFGRHLPCLNVCDWPDFARRGVMLDISRGRVPKLKTLLELVDRLADFKINEFQLYTEHTFAYRHFKSVWRSWGALTGGEVRTLDARCRELGIDLVPNQNSFGHLRYFLEHPRLKKLAEVPEPYEDSGGGFLRYPSTLAPEHPGTLPFLRGLYAELLPNFSSRFFNVGCDETWDLGRGRSKKPCEAKGKGRVYVDFLKKIHREVSARGKQMMFWGDIILHHPKLIRELPKNLIALNWGYEANHPFEREAAQFARSKIPFYMCPGTSTWMTLIGRHDNALANLRRAADAGRRRGAIGYLITDWGDGGHPQPLAVSYLPYLAGAAVSWCAKTFDEATLIPVLSRDIFHDSTQCIAKAASALGVAHRKFNFFTPNLTPFGAVIAAPRRESHELFCRDGLKYYAQIPRKRIRAALDEVEKQRVVLSRAKPGSRSGKILALELDLAARMAAQSCQFMLWQKALASGRNALARQMANNALRELRVLEEDFNTYWPLRNKATTRKCSAFLCWRINDYRKGVLPFPARSV